MRTGTPDGSAQTADRAPHKARMEHHVRGRIRVKVASAKGNPALLNELRQQICALDGVTEVSSNSDTGSIVVNYDPGEHAVFSQRFVEHGERHGLLIETPEISEVDDFARKIQVEAEYLSEHSQTARAVVDIVKQLDGQIKLATGNRVDLKVLLPLGLAVYSLLEIGLEAATPLWVTLGIFSFNSFISLHAAAPGDVQTRQEVIVQSGCDAGTTEPADSKSAKQAPTRTR